MSSKQQGYGFKVYKFNRAKPNSKGNSASSKIFPKLPKIDFDEKNKKNVELHIPNKSELDQIPK